MLKKYWFLIRSNMKIKFNIHISPNYFNNFVRFNQAGYDIYCHKDFTIAIKNQLSQLINHKQENNQIYRNLVNIVYQQDIKIEKSVKKVVIKKSIHRSLYKKIISNFQPSKATKAFIAAKFLLENGLDTPIPIAVIEKRNHGFLVDAYYITEAIFPHERVKKLYKQYLPDNVKRYEISQFLKSIASYTRQMHKLGFMHRDLNLSNFLLSPIDDENYRLCLIDLNRGKFYFFLSSFQKIRDISRLYWKELRSEFFYIYCDNDRNLIAYKSFYDRYYRFRKKRRKIKQVMK